MYVYVYVGDLPQHTFTSTFTGPPMQSTAAPQTDAGVGIGMKIMRNLIIFNEKG